MTFDPLLKAHSEQLTHKIRQEIESVGPLSFARFMELALYAPGLGYYSASSQKLGKEGDFITAPEITPLFAACIAHQCGPFLSKDQDFLEIGAGSGRFALDFLTALEEKGQLPKHYFILEISENLRTRQKHLLSTTLPHFFPRIVWLDRLPAAFEGIIFANEVLDAIPFHCFAIENNVYKEKCVIFENQAFQWQLQPPSQELALSLRHLLESVVFPDHYASEINLHLPSWIKTLGESLHKGILLLLDYGYGRSEYYHPARRLGTLTCFSQHQKHANPFINIGLQDITAHVDFTLVAEHATLAGLSLCGFTHQASFLLANDLLTLAEKNAKNTLEYYQEAQAIKRLTLPLEMGEVIKVMAFSKNSEFSLNMLHDRRRDL